MHTCDIVLLNNSAFKNSFKKFFVFWSKYIYSILTVILNMKLSVPGQIAL